MKKYYAGIGSRETPEEILETMTSLAGMLEKEGYTLRSGGADGADTAFEAGAHNKEIFYAKDCTRAAMEYSSKFHPAWNKLGFYVKQLMGRNAQQIAGRDGTVLVEFVICWTPDGAEHSTSIKTGGTGQAIRIANALGVPVINMANEGWYKALQAILDSTQ